MSAANLEAGLVAFLRADAALAALVGTRVFGSELPPAETAAMPRRALVLRASGGVSLTGDSFLEHDTQRIDAFAFGATPLEAAQVMRAAAAALRNLRRSVHAGVLIHWVNSAGGSAAGREPTTEWPRQFQSFQVFFALNEVE
jgi:hypothetical protein